MSQPLYEICSLDTLVWEVASGIFGSKYQVKCVARFAGQTISESSTYIHQPAPKEYKSASGEKGILRDFEYRTEVRHRAYQQLLRKLMNDGWEVVSTNEHGDVTQMRRLIHPSDTRTAGAQSPSNVELLPTSACIPARSWHSYRSGISDEKS